MGWEYSRFPRRALTQNSLKEFETSIGNIQDHKTDFLTNSIFGLSLVLCLPFIMNTVDTFAGFSRFWMSQSKTRTNRPNADTNAFRKICKKIGGPKLLVPAAGGRFSEAWGPPQFQEKRPRSEKAILGALGAFRDILGAALGAQKIILGMRNPILGMASHDLCSAKTTILGATPRAIPGNWWEPTWKIFLCILGALFSKIGVVPVRGRF